MFKLFESLAKLLTQTTICECRIYSFCSTGLIFFFNQTHYRALIQARALVIFKVKLCTKVIFEDKSFTALILFSCQFTHLINAICYAIGRLQGMSVIYLLLSFNSVVTQALIIFYYYTTEKSAFSSGGYTSTDPYLFLCSVYNGRLFKRALNQDRAVKRVYTVILVLSDLKSIFSIGYVIQCALCNIRRFFSGKSIGFLFLSMCIFGSNQAEFNSLLIALIYR